MRVLQFVSLARCSLMLLSGFASMPLRAQRSNVAPPPGSITVVRDSRPVVLTRVDLAKLPRRELRVVAEGATDSVTVSGVNLWDVLQAVGAPSVEASGRQRAVMYVRLKGSDGQNAVLALVEVDPGFSRRTVLVADHRNGKVLDESEGPWRVIIPDDLRHARWIRGLVSVEIATLTP